MGLFFLNNNISMGFDSVTGKCVSKCDRRVLLGGDVSHWMIDDMAFSVSFFLFHILVDDVIGRL